MRNYDKVEIYFFGNTGHNWIKHELKWYKRNKKVYDRNIISKKGKLLEYDHVEYEINENELRDNVWIWNKWKWATW